MRPLILTLLAVALLPAADPAPKLPPTAEKAYKAYVAQLTKAYQAETDKLRLQLKKEMETATKKGDLDSAMAVKGLMAKVDDGQGLDDARAGLKQDALVDVREAPVAVTDVKEAEKFVVGTWDAQCSNGWRGTHTIKPDRVIMGSDGNIGTWSVSSKTFTVTWQNGITERFLMPVKSPLIGNGSLGQLTWTKRE
jgi:hypothetical protein